ncbi:MAG: alpha/beta hydrolase [Bryobacterales bacterium]|nr:alpha/beta hydrolase [Bryobacterales bacterium]
MKFVPWWIAVAPLLAQQTLSLRPGVAGPTPEKIEQRGTAEANDRAVSNVSEPTLTVYLPPKEKATGVAIVICPGGGYARLAIDKEGHDIARFLNSVGVAGIVLKYRLPGSMNGSREGFDAAIAAAKVAIDDGELAMEATRKHAVEWNIRPDAVGMMGFSAGGHLAAMVGMSAPAAARPDFLVLVYPALPRELRVTAETPRTFLVHADDDRLAPADNSIPFYLALKKAKVSAELHVYSGGGHGFGMKKSGKTSENWPLALAAWLN